MPPSVTLGVMSKVTSIGQHPVMLQVSNKVLKWLVLLNTSETSMENQKIYTNYFSTLVSQNAPLNCFLQFELVCVHQGYILRLDHLIMCDFPTLLKAMNYILLCWSSKCWYLLCYDVRHLTFLTSHWLPFSFVLSSSAIFTISVDSREDDLLQCPSSCQRLCVLCRCL